MANELNWIRNKATHLQTETMVVTAEQAGSECVPGTYQIERFGFIGTIPFRMARALSSCVLINTDSEQEVLHLGTGYRGGEGQCRYYRSVYTLMGA